MDGKSNSYYRVNKFLLSCIGQWPYQTKFQKLFIRILVYTAILSLLLAEILGLMESWGDVDATIECITPLILRLTSIVLVSNCIYNMDKIKEISSEIGEDWTYWLSTPEAEILHAYARKGQIMTIGFSTCLFSSMFLYLDIPMIPIFLDLILPLNESRPKITLYKTEYYLDEENYFYWTYMHGYIAAVISTVILVSVDTMLMVFIQHACGILAILGFISGICDSYSTAYFLILGFNMLVISVTGFQTVMKLNSPPDVMRFGSLTLTQIFHLFCLSVPCQQLIDHSVSISDSIYNGYWYELSTDSQKMLLIIMRRGLDPCSFTAGKIFVFSMQNFSLILRTSMSYFTLLSSVRG